MTLGAKEPRAQRGFTLMELLLVMVVIGTVGIMVLPRLSGSMAWQRLETEARAVVALCKKARALAAGEGRSYVVQVDGQDRELRLVRRRDPLAEATLEDDPELEEPENQFWARPIPFEDGVQVAEGYQAGESLDASQPIQIEFRPDGTSDPIDVVLESKDGDKLIVTINQHLGTAKVLREGTE